MFSSNPTVRAVRWVVVLVSVILLVPVELLPVIRDDCLVVHSNMVSALGSYN